VGNSTTLSATTSGTIAAIFRDFLLNTCNVCLSLWSNNVVDLVQVIFQYQTKYLFWWWMFRI